MSQSQSSIWKLSLIVFSLCKVPRTPFIPLQWLGEARILTKGTQLQQDTWAESLLSDFLVAWIYTSCLMSLASVSFWAKQAKRGFQPFRAVVKIKPVNMLGVLSVMLGRGWTFWGCWLYLWRLQSYLPLQKNSRIIGMIRNTKLANLNGSTQ